MRFENRFSPLMNIMVKTVRFTSRNLLRDFGELEKLQISTKSLGDFVSSADINAEKTLVQDLQKARPDFGFLLEEKGEIKGKDETHRWIIDPLDGTTNFLNGIPHWAISVALEETTHKGAEIIAGVVYDATKDELFWAEKGQGAFLNSQRLRVSGRDHLNQAVVASGFPTLRGLEYHDTFLQESASLMKKVAAIRRMGAASLDLAYVAAGRYEGYWERGLYPWDVAAAELIIREAGGIVSDMQDGKNYINGKTIVAANNKLHQPLLKILQEVNC